MDPQILEVLLSEMEMQPGGRAARARAARPGRADGALRPRPARAQGRAVRAGHPPAAVGGRDAQERLRHPARGRRPGPPPLPLVRDQRAALHRAGRRRSARAGDQADALPHLRRLPDRHRADRGRRGRQAGRRPRRDQGPVRRGGQHHLGPLAGAGRLPRRLRAGRPEDALQDGAGGPPGARRAAPVLPHRHRQLQPEDRPHLRGPRHPHRRPAGRAPTSPTCSTPSPATRGRRTTGC